jgi:hypothetical protein
VSGLFPEAGALAGIWVAAGLTMVVLAAGLGARSLFGVAQHLLAGLLTGLLVLLAIREVLAPRLIGPLLADPRRLDLWVTLVLVAVLVAAPLVPRRLAAVPIGILVAGTAAFALGGAVSGTLIPQLAAGVAALDASGWDLIAGWVGLALTGLVLVGFIHGAPETRIRAGMAVAGRWVLVSGLGGFLGFLLVSRLALLVDRLTFLVVEWIGIGR